MRNENSSKLLKKFKLEFIILCHWIKDPP